MSDPAPYAKGTAKIKHSTTGKVYNINADELDWDVADIDGDRGMGAETHWEAQIEHAELGQLAWHVWEYPAGAENMTETDANGHEVVENLQYGLN